MQHNTSISSALHIYEKITYTLQIEHLGAIHWGISLYLQKSFLKSYKNDA